MNGKSAIAAISVALSLVGWTAANAAVSVTDQGLMRQQQQKLAKVNKHRGANSQIVLPATGSVSLVDACGLKYFINTNITFSTSSSASGAMSEASFTGPHQVTTMGGGLVMSTLDDMFDGYNSLCTNVNGALSATTCTTGSAFWTMYDKLGAAVADATCIEPAGGGGIARQYVFPIQTLAGLQVHRKVYVPSADTFARWLNYFTNTTGSAMTVNMGTGNNLGSDSNTIITGSSVGAVSPINSTAVTWIASFQNYSGTTSSDPRIGHVLQQAGAATGLAFVNFVNGDDNPFWGYRFTLAPGQTVIIANFATGQNSKAAAAAKATQLAGGGNANAFNCMSATEKGQLANFQAGGAPIAGIPTLSNVYLALLALLLAAVTAFVVQRRRSGR